MTALRLGTRGSALAVTQSGLVAAALRAATGRDVELVTIRTEGDVRIGPLAAMSGTGVFVTAIREALARGEVDVVVHSGKDLPARQPDGIALACVPGREDPDDALCARGRTLAQLPAGARIGTGSPRRAAQLLRLRPDLDVVGIRGNVDTRLAAVDEGRFDGVVLAAAGLNRLGRADRIDDRPDMLPAPVQGALAVECRTADLETPLGAALGRLDDPAAHAAVDAERALLCALDAGCSAPVGALAEVVGGELTLRAGVFSPDGRTAHLRIGSGYVDAAVAVGVQVAADLLVAGAGALIPANR